MVRSLIVIVLAIVSLPAAYAAPIDLICKNFTFGGAVGGYTPNHSSAITYERVTVSVPGGTTRTIFAPTQLVVIHQFQGVRVAAGHRGENLTMNQCGLESSVITGINLDPKSGQPDIQFYGFASTFVQTGAGVNGVTVSFPAVNFPPCPSGVLRFHANQENPNSYFLADGPGAVTCIP